MRHIHHAIADLRLGFEIVIDGISFKTEKEQNRTRIVPNTRERALLSATENAALGLAKRAGLIPELWVAKTNKTGLKTAEVEAFLTAPPSLKQVTSAPIALPITKFENTKILGFDDDEGKTHFALIIGEIEQGSSPIARLHSSCITGDVLASLKCDCGLQLNMAIEKMVEAGAGILLYLNQEGRGIGLANKLRAYELQSDGADTVDANHSLGFEADERDFRIAAIMLKALSISKIALLSNNPEKARVLEQNGIVIEETLSIVVDANQHNQHYLETKFSRLGHRGE